MNQYILSITTNGYAKLTEVDEFRLQNPGGKGIVLQDASDVAGPVVAMALVSGVDGDVLIATRQGQCLRCSASRLRVTGRNAQGVKAIDLADGDSVVDVITLPEVSAVAGFEDGE